MAISDTKLRKLLDKNQTPCVLSHRDSLSVRVSAKGAITWQYRCGVNGKQVIISLGRYLGLTIKQAQDYIPHFQNWLSQGKDPRIELKLMRNEGKPLDLMTNKDWIKYFDDVKAQGSAKTAGTILVRIKSIIG